jgi:hypothetical protein
MPFLKSDVLRKRAVLDIGAFVNEAILVCTLNAALSDRHNTATKHTRRFMMQVLLLYTS